MASFSYTCNDGFRFNNSAENKTMTITCGPSGQWSDLDFSCVSKLSFWKQSFGEKVPKAAWIFFLPFRPQRKVQAWLAKGTFKSLLVWPYLCQWFSLVRDFRDLPLVSSGGIWSADWCTLKWLKKTEPRQICMRFFGQHSKHEVWN